MPATATLNLADALRLTRRFVLRADLVFDTAWRVGSGKEGETMCDLGVVLDARKRPVLPGSSVRGRLRSACEAIAYALNLSACQLNVKASGVACASDVTWYSDHREEHRKALEGGPERLLAWVDQNTCGVCKLFGSPVRASRLRCSDGTLDPDSAAVVQVRDGVVLDRDSHTAVKGLKYDYEVTSSGTRFGIRFDLDNPTDADLALFGAAVFEWSAGASLGGGTGRGLGRFRLENIALQRADLTNPRERIEYLTNTDPEKRLKKLDDWQKFFTTLIEQQAAQPPEARA